VILDVHLLLVRDEHVVLTQRRGGYGHGRWHLPSGKAEVGESIEDAVIREANEEVGVTVAPADVPRSRNFQLPARNSVQRVRMGPRRTAPNQPTAATTRPVLAPALVT
jgi:8-oxo-dGTP pyrophosphatase MutT (NUDIX family)